MHRFFLVVLCIWQTLQMRTFCMYVYIYIVVIVSNVSVVCPLSEPYKGGLTYALLCLLLYLCMCVCVTWLISGGVLWVHVPDKNLVEHNFWAGFKIKCLQRKQASFRTIVNSFNSYHYLFLQLKIIFTFENYYYYVFCLVLTLLFI